MTEPNRRRALQILAAMTSGAAVGSGVSGCASTINAVGSAPIASPFAVSAAFTPFAGSTMVFQVRRICCIGRNYTAHAREMGSDPTYAQQLFFQKPTVAIQKAAPGTVADCPDPTLTKNYRCEVAFGAALSNGGRDI